MVVSQHFCPSLLVKLRGVSKKSIVLISFATLDWHISGTAHYSFHITLKKETF